MNYIWQHLEETQRVLEKIDSDSVEKMVDILVETKSKAGRIFFLGVGEVRQMLLMPSMIFEKFVAWKLMHQLIMCLN